MLMELTHETVFEYSEPVSEAYMEFRLTPLTDSSQHLLQHRPRVSPHRPVRNYVDGLGNTVSYFNLLAPHDRIEVCFDSLVETYSLPFRGHALPEERRSSPSAMLQLFDYLGPTPLTAWGEEFHAWVKPLEELRNATPQEAANSIREAIHGGFRYEGSVTNASSPITDLLRQGAGVCQDFAHLMLATCRYLGFPARYVSGYVLPEEGQVTAASHAWCEVYDMRHGWFGIDPTHNTWTQEHYVRIGTGRDFSDVAPNRGVFRGRAEEVMHVRVQLRRIHPEELAGLARALYTQRRANGGGGLRHVRRPEPVSSMLQSLYAQQQQQQQDQQQQQQQQ